MKVTNLVLDPLMKTPANWTGNSVNMSIPKVKLSPGATIGVTATADSGENGQSWVETEVRTAVGQRYIFSAYLYSADAATFPLNRVLAVAVPVILGTALFDGANKRYTVEFVAENPATQLRLYAPSVNGKKAEYIAPICALKSEYEYLTSKIGLKYFDYTTMPLQRS